MSTRLFDVYPDLFEESYNWLNCPSLPPPSIEDPYKEDYEELPADVFSPISYEELYINGDTEVDSDITLYPPQEAELGRPQYASEYPPPHSGVSGLEGDTSL